jgi:cob(I)alamin adenosyltransferase
LRGLIHIYTGDGKGKTTAAVGLCVRFAGSGGKVLFSQFLKDDASSEIGVLKMIPNITFLPSGKYFGFSFRMTEETKELAKEHYEQYMERVFRAVAEGTYGLLVMDEIIAADNLHFISHSLLLDFLRNKPEELEVVLTGREPSGELVDEADYVSEICCRKHPFQRGVGARVGIER